MMTFEGDIEKVVAEYLRHAQPSTRTTVIEDALQHFIAKLDHKTQDRILPGFVRRRKPRPGPNVSRRRRKETTVNELNGGVDKALLLAVTFLNERQRERALKDSKLRPTVEVSIVRGALTALREGHVWICNNDIGALWTLGNSAVACEPSDEDSPIQRLVKLYQKTNASVHSGEYKRRILALLIHHECRKSGIPMNDEGNEELEKLKGLCSQSINDLVFTAQAWIRVINSWGMGGLVMLGPGQRGVFERELSKEQVRDLWAFCEKHMLNIALKVGSLHGTVKDLLVESMRIARMDVTALETVQTPLAEAYRTYWRQGVVLPSEVTRYEELQPTICPNSSGLDALAAAAFQQDLQHDENHPESEVGPEHILQPGQAQVGLVESHEPPACASHQIGANSLDIAQQLETGQNLGGQWHSGANSWRPTGLAPDSPFTGPSIFPLGYNGDCIPMGHTPGALPINTGQSLTDEWLNALRADDWFMGGFEI